MLEGKISRDSLFIRTGLCYTHTHKKKQKKTKKNKPQKRETTNLADPGYVVKSYITDEMSE